MSVGMAACSVPIAIYLARHMGLLFGVYSGYLLIHSVCVATFPFGRNVNLPVILQNQVAITSAFSLLNALIVFLGVFLLTKLQRDVLRKSIPIVTTIDALYVIHSSVVGFRLPGGFGFTGLLDYCGVNGMFIALGCAFLIPDKSDSKRVVVFKMISLLISVAGIILSKTAIPFGVLGIVISSNLFMRNKNMVGIFLFPLFLSLVLGYSVVGSKMVNSSGRFQAYEIFMKLLKEEKKITFGTGIGTLRDFSKTAQYRRKFMEGWDWDKLHSDWLQNLFQMGVVSFVFVIALYLQCLWMAYRRGDTALFSLGIGIGGGAAIDYLFWYFITSLMVTYFVVECLKREECRIEWNR